MRYELYLRASEAPVDLAARILDDLGKMPEVTQTASGCFEHTGDVGRVAVDLHPAGASHWDKGKGSGAPEGPIGLDLSVAGGAGAALASELVDLAFDWAARWSLDVYDPQLGRTVEKEDLEAITARIKRHSEYLTDTVGLGDRSTPYMDVDVPVVRMGLRSRFYLGLAAALVLLGLAAHYCS